MAPGRVCVDEFDELHSLLITAAGIAAERRHRLRAVLFFMLTLLV